MARGKKMAPGLFVAIIIFIITIDWMACDIFLPAEPDILAYFDTTAATLASPSRSTRSCLSWAFLCAKAALGRTASGRLPSTSRTRSRTDT